MLRTLSWLAVVLLCGTPGAAGENWPQFRGPDGDGRSTARDLPLRWSETAGVRWKTAIHGRGWSSPVVWGDQVWLTTATADGKELFAVCIDRRSGRVVHDLKIFDVAQPEKINPLNSYASPTPVIEEGRVYVYFGAYGTACLDTRSGKLLWQRRDLKCDHIEGPGSSPALYGKLLLLHFDGGDVQFVTALDSATGETVWRTDRSLEYAHLAADLRKAYSTPTVFRHQGRAELVSPAAEGVVAYDPLSGKELWKVRYSGFSIVGRPVLVRDTVLITTGFGATQLLAVRLGGHGDVTATHVAWKQTRSVPVKPSLVAAGELLFMVSDSGIASCLEAAGGKVVWQKRLAGAYSASPLAAAGRIYFFSQDGPATVIRAGRKYEQLAANKLDGGFMASPAVAGKSLFVRTATHLYCIEP